MKVPTLITKPWNKLRHYVITHPDFSIFLGLVILKIGLLLVNIGNYPYVENDEATYTLRATSFSESGKLDYYTYWYDHAPAGWILMSPFILINSFLNTPISDILLLRLLIITITGIGVGLTYLIGVKLFKRRLPALIAVTLLLASPLAAYYQRRILLDSIMTFLLLLSIYVIVRKPRKLQSYGLSGVIFGLSILSKINAVFVVPAMWLLIWQQQKNKMIRRHALILWTFLAGSVTSLWLLFAGLKGELLPYNKAPETGAFEKISLIDTLKFQSARGGEPKWPWDPASNVYPNALDWFQRDPLLISLIAFSFVVTTFMLIYKKRREQTLFIWLVFVLLSFFVVRGGVVLGFYVLPLIPFGALMVGRTFSPAFYWLKKQKIRNALLAVTLIAILVIGLIPMSRQWNKNEVSNQLQAVEWVKKNIPDKDTLIISDNYALPYLIEEGYTNVDYQFKVEYDPDVNAKKYGKDWRNGAYMIISHEVLRQIKEGTTPFVREAFDHSVKVADFTKGSSSYIDTKQYISTNGDWAQIYKIKTDEGIYLQDGWKAYKQNFIKSYGQVVTPKDKLGSVTTSTNQAATMQVAVNEDDQAVFDGVWQWTIDHFRNRTEDKLLSSGWGIAADGKEGLTDTNTTSSANTQAALALIMAHEKWGDAKYLSAARLMMADMQAKETRTLGGKQLQIPFVTNLNDPSYPINPSYGDPYAYEKFAKYSEKNSVFWKKMATDYYAFIASLQDRNTTGLVSDWVVVSTNGTISSAENLIGVGSDGYGFEAYKIPQTLARAKVKGNDPRADVPLSRFAEFYNVQLELTNKDDKIFSIYGITGQPAVVYEDIATTVSAVSSMKALDSYTKTSELERDKITGQYNKKKHYWGIDKNNIRNQLDTLRYYDLFYNRL
jgi:endo-1,4-beta-D-glucanase Y/4-amino-4-deoxy-L-arabinose transferase-like glycosyltransferase